MTERYLWAHSVMHHHNELNVTKELVTGSCIMERVKRLADNEIEHVLVIGILTCMSMSMTTGRSHRSCLNLLYDLRVNENTM